MMLPNSAQSCVAARRVLTETFAQADALILYRQVLTSPIMLQLRQAIAASDPSATGSAYAEFLHTLAEFRPLSFLDGSCWQRYLASVVLCDQNNFTTACARHEDTSAYRALLEHDLRIINALYNMDFSALEADLAALEAGLSALEASLSAPVAASSLPDPPLPVISSIPPHSCGPNPLDDSPYRRELAAALAGGEPWTRQVDLLTRFHQHNGAGMCVRFAALRWQPAACGYLAGVETPDPVRLDNLAEYKAEREAIIDNTERFLSGLPACNVLLYGDKGTGKSATVKALLWEYARRGLRIVELERSRLADVSIVLETLRYLGGKFILFADDLSFDEGDSSYKDLKAVLEGSLTARPANVVMYVTSNRRHLVTEKIADRQPSFSDDAEFRWQDALQEKLSVADRFGLTVIFASPDQESYVRIAAHLAKQAGIDVEFAELRAKAIRWALWRNGQTPRSAQQFVDDLKAEITG